MKKTRPAPQEIAQENKKLRMLRFMVDYTLSLIYQNDMPREEALLHFTKVRRFALKLFPEKELAFELLYAPKFKRAMREIYVSH